MSDPVKAINDFFDIHGADKAVKVSEKTKYKFLKFFTREKEEVFGYITLTHRKKGVTVWLAPKADAEYFYGGVYAVDYDPDGATGSVYESALTLHVVWGKDRADIIIDKVECVLLKWAELNEQTIQRTKSNTVRS